MASTKTFVDMRANPVDAGDFIVTVMKGQGSRSSRSETASCVCAC